MILPSASIAPHAGKIRIGYLSNDFHDHATLLLLIEMFEAHDRAHFEVHGFSFGADDGKAMRRRLRDAFILFMMCLR